MSMCTDRRHRIEAFCPLVIYRNTTNSKNILSFSYFQHAETVVPLGGDDPSPVGDASHGVGCQRQGHVHQGSIGSTHPPSSQEVI